MTGTLWLILIVLAIIALVLFIVRRQMPDAEQDDPDATASEIADAARRQLELEYEAVLLLAAALDRLNREQ